MKSRMLDQHGVAVTSPGGPLWRVGRATAPYAFSWITPEIDARDDAGNRFDVLGSGVLYAASTPRGAFNEVSQGFRPTTATRAAAAKSQPGLMLSGNITG